MQKINNYWNIVDEVGFPKDFRGNEIAIGYVKYEIDFLGTLEFEYLPIYFSNGDWFICNNSKSRNHELIAYARVDKFEKKKLEEL